MSQIALFYTTVPDEETGKSIAQALVKKRLAACVNIVPAGTSVYRWEGRVETAQEQLLLIKSRREHAGKLEQAITELHPYDVPCLLELPVQGGSQAFLDWVAEETAHQA